MVDGLLTRLAAMLHSEGQSGSPGLCLGRDWISVTGESAMPPDAFNIESVDLPFPKRRLAPNPKVDISSRNGSIWHPSSAKF